MNCLICQQSLTTDYQLVGIERGTWRSLYACPGLCAEQAWQGTVTQKTLDLSAEAEG